ncbi:hypothetical protein [Persephonella sp.]
MIDKEFLEKCLKQREKIEAILEAEVLELKNGKGILNFNNDGVLMEIKIEKVSYKRKKKS